MASEKTPVPPAKEGRWHRAVIRYQGFVAERTRVNTVTIRRGTRNVAQISRRNSHDRIRCCSFVPVANASGDSPRVVIGSDYGLTLHDAVSGRTLRTFVGHTGDIVAVACSPDGRRLVSGSMDQTFRLWSLQGDSSRVEPMLSFFVTYDGEWVAWTPEGYYKASANGHDLIGWHCNQGVDKAARFLHAWQLRRTYERPEVVELVPTAGSTSQAVELLNQDPRKRRERPADVRDELPTSLPPAVVIHSPKSHQIVSARTVTLRAELQLAHNQVSTQAISVRIMVNRRPIPFRVDPDSAQPETEAMDDDVTRKIVLNRPIGRGVIVEEIPLVSGENEIAVMAWNESAMGEPARVSVVSRPPQPTAGITDLHVLAIGVSDYQDSGVRDLQYADDDAIGVAGALKAQHGRLYRNVHTDVLVDDQATRREILLALERLRKRVIQTDLAIVFVSGHGDRDAADRYFFVPHDFKVGHLMADAIRWSEFQDTLSRLPCRVILAMDTCHAAGVTGLELRGRSRHLAQRSIERLLAELTSFESGLFVLSSSLPAELSRERHDWGHGAFALSLIEAIRGNHLGKAARTPLPADDNRNGVVELPELRTYVLQRVRELTGGDQHASSHPRGLPDLPIAPVMRR